MKTNPKHDCAAFTVQPHDRRGKFLVAFVGEGEDFEGQDFWGKAAFVYGLTERQAERQFKKYTAPGSTVGIFKVIIHRKKVNRRSKA